MFVIKGINLEWPMVGNLVPSAVRSVRKKKEKESDNN